MQSPSRYSIFHIIRPDIGADMETFGTVCMYGMSLCVCWHVVCVHVYPYAWTCMDLLLMS